ncbi:MAG: hypothetical protein JOZ24_11365 [Candidatus Eremiobacteraeota bacterium]|nr:hypothetical protein [Candidatus Eremiobacteraeota bacterium]
MGTERAELVVALQAALMRAAHAFGAEPAVAPLLPRALAGAAALDYALMLARNADSRETAAGSKALPTAAEAEARERAMHEGIERAVDDLLAAANAISSLRTPEARIYAADAAGLARAAIRSEGLETQERSFAVIALTNA